MAWLVNVVGSLVVYRTALPKIAATNFAMPSRLGLA